MLLILEKISISLIETLLLIVFYYIWPIHKINNNIKVSYIGFISFVMIVFFYANLSSI